MNKGILKTVVYYNCLNYPLTRGELDTFSLIGKDEISPDSIEESDGLYFLAGCSDLIQTRKEREKIAEKKWEKALKAVKWLQLVPYIKLIFASGSLAFNNTSKESDLDLLIVAKSGRIWTSRFLAVVLLGLLGLRRKRHQRVAPDKLCLNHFITDKSLHIPRKSIYTAQLYARLVPVLGDDNLIEEFCEANAWIGDYVVGWPETIKLKFKNEKLKVGVKSSKFLNFVKRAGERILNTKLGNWVEGFLRKYQLRRIKNYHLTYKPGGRVKADDESLEFHPDSPEAKIIEKYNRTMIRLGFPELANEKDSGLNT